MLRRSRPSHLEKGGARSQAGPLRGDHARFAITQLPPIKIFADGFDLGAYRSGKRSFSLIVSARTLTAVPNASTLFPASDTSGLEDFFSRCFVVKGHKGIEQ